MYIFDNTLHSIRGRSFAMYHTTPEGTNYVEATMYTVKWIGYSATLQHLMKYINHRLRSV